MSVSLYYRAHRATPLTKTEAATLERVTTTRRATFPYDDEEDLYLYKNNDDEPGELLAGSTKMPSDPSRLIPVIAHVLDSVTELRRTLPDAHWHVHLDDLDVPWDESQGYTLPGIRD